MWDDAKLNRVINAKSQFHTDHKRILVQNLIARKEDIAILSDILGRREKNSF